MSDSAPPKNRGGAPRGNRNALGHGAPRGNSNSVGHGAPRGNKNAFKHGFYSRWFTRQEHERLDGEALGKLQDEENSLSILIGRVFATFNSEEMSNEKYLAATRTVALAVGRIESIHRTRRAIYDNFTHMEKTAQ